MGPHRRARQTRPAVDGPIVTTAVVLSMTVVTRNVRDFAGSGADILNPFEPPLS